MGFYPATGGQAVAGPLTVSGLLTANAGAVINAPVTPTTTTALTVNDTGSGRSGAAQEVIVNATGSVPIWAVPPAGGPKVFGDKSGSWPTVLTEGAQLVPWMGVQVGGASGPTFYGGSGAPLPAAITGQMTTFGTQASVGDLYGRTDATGTANERLYICTVAGNPGTWTGIV